MLFVYLLKHSSSLRYISRILKLLNQRKLEAFKENWWNKNPNKKSCEEFEEDSGGGISIYNIGMGVISLHFIQYKTSLHVTCCAFEYYNKLMNHHYFQVVCLSLFLLELDWLYLH